MYNKFRKCIRSSNLRGWSYLLEEKKSGDSLYYLSKFDKREKRNLNEYKIYFKIENKEIRITNALLVKSYTKVEAISKYNEHLVEAKTILRSYAALMNYSFVEK